jgi:NAD(P)-dependent dehydrogenase (short-subunit alcohol dehydrogenase family)
MSGRRDLISTTHSTSYDFISPLKLDLTGRTVIITGTAWEDGVGQATAVAFARAGARAIGLIDLQQVSADSIAKVEAAATEAGRSKPLVKAYAVDISDLASVQAMQKTLGNDLGEHLDILINNAAHQEPYKTILESDPTVDWRTWDVNVHGLLNMTRTFLPALLASHANAGGLATIINVASSGALSARAGSANYRSSKLAILRWTEILQLDHKEAGLVAFCVNPGAIKTQMTVNEPENVRDRLPHKPDIAGDTIAWLASERRGWLGGRYVSCPWDMEELLSRKEEIIEGDKLKMKLVM